MCGCVSFHTHVPSRQVGILHINVGKVAVKLYRLVSLTVDEGSLPSQVCPS